MMVLVNPEKKFKKNPTNIKKKFPETIFDNQNQKEYLITREKQKTSPKHKKKFTNQEKQKKKTYKFWNILFNKS